MSFYDKFAEYSGKILYQVEKAFSLPFYLIPGHKKRRYKVLHSALSKLVTGDEIPPKTDDTLIKNYASYSMKIEKDGFKEPDRRRKLDGWEHYILTLQNLGPKLIHGTGVAAIIYGFKAIDDPNLNFLHPHYVEEFTAGSSLIFLGLAAQLTGQMTHQQAGDEFIEGIKNLPEDKMLKLKQMVMAGRTDEGEIERAIKFLRTEC